MAGTSSILRRLPTGLAGAIRGADVAVEEDHTVDDLLSDLAR